MLDTINKCLAVMLLIAIAGVIIVGATLTQVSGAVTFTFGTKQLAFAIPHSALEGRQ